MNGRMGSILIFTTAGAISAEGNGSILPWHVYPYSKMELIILDEAMLALDNDTELRVIEELHAHAANTDWTMFMVAHRLTTLRNADRVLVMDGGRVEQRGGTVIIIFGLGKLKWMHSIWTMVQL